MKRAFAIGLLVAAIVGCAGRAAVAPDVLKDWQSRTLYTCCNIHYESTDINDANYSVGTILPLGSPVTIDKMTGNSVTFHSGATTLTLVQAYGHDQEPSQKYFGKIFVSTDPRTTFNSYSKQVQQAITDGRVERNMTREQVLMSLGYPPTHKTPSIDSNVWTYWYNRWVTYTVTFDDQGKVTLISGPAPTHSEPIVEATPVPTPAPASHKRKSK